MGGVCGGCMNGVSGGVCSLLEGYNSSDLSCCFGWTFSHHHTTAHTKELRVVKEATPNTGLLPHRQRVLKGERRGRSEGMHMVLLVESLSPCHVWHQ